MQRTTNDTVYEPGNHSAVAEIKFPADIARELGAPDHAIFLGDGESAIRVFGPIPLRTDRPRTHDEFANDFALMVVPELEGREFTIRHFSVETDRKAA
ncbi:hypothetical protein ACWCRC_38890 [Streptomyces sp. NPDC001940]